MKRFLAVTTAVLMAAALLSGCSSAKNTEDVILDEAFSDEEYVVGFRKGDQALCDEVQRILVEMKKDGKLAEISNTWFGADNTTVPEEFTPSGAADDSLTRVKDKGTLVLGLDDSFPPMGFRDEDNNIVGFDIDVAKEVCSRMGVTLKLEAIDWDSKVSELNEGNVDCLWNGFTSDPDRAKAMTLSQPYMKNRQVVVTLKDSGIDSVEDLKDKTLVLQSGSTAENALEAHPEIKSSLKEAVAVKNNVVAMYDLGKGGSDAVLMDEVVARYYIGHEEQLAQDGKTE